MSKLTKLTVSAASLVLFVSLAHAQEGIPVGEGYLGNTLPTYPGGISGGVNEQLYSYDNQTLWQHGQFQEIPPYGGHFSFRPYNYRHVFSQAQTAAGWGEKANMPYSQQFWHRYADRARMERIAPREGVKAAADATSQYRAPRNPAPMQPYGTQPYGSAQQYRNQTPAYNAPTYNPPAGNMQPTPVAPQPYGSPAPANPMTPPPPAAGFNGNYRSATFQIPMTTSQTQPMLPPQQQLAASPQMRQGQPSTVQQVQHLRQQLHQLEAQMAREIETSGQRPTVPQVRFPSGPATSVR